MDGLTPEHLLPCHLKLHIRIARPYKRAAKEQIVRLIDVVSFGFKLDFNVFTINIFTFLTFEILKSQTDSILQKIRLLAPISGKSLYGSCSSGFKEH